MELLHEARRRKREYWESVRGLRSERWSLGAAPARQLEQGTERSNSWLDVLYSSVICIIDAYFCGMKQMDAYFCRNCRIEHEEERDSPFS